MVAVPLDYLRRLGIDVWVPKQTDGNIAGSRVVLAREAPKLHPLGNEAAPLSSGSAVGPRFTIRGFRVERVLGLVAEEAFSDMSLILDIARAITGFKSAEADEFVFVWPQVEGSETSWDDAIKAFNAFCRSQIGPEDVVLAVGRDLVRLMAPAENLSKEQVIALDGAPRDGTAKYELWQKIRVLVR